MTDWKAAAAEHLALRLELEMTRNPETLRPERSTSYYTDLAAIAVELVAAAGSEPVPERNAAGDIVIGAWGSDGLGHGIHIPSYNAGKRAAHPQIP